jgi:hypothetical protein
MALSVESCREAESFTVLSPPVEELPSFIMSFIRLAWHSVFCFFFTPLATELLAVPQCPGYIASHVHSTASGITADLRLAGEPCNIYGNDLRNLRFKAEYQTGIDLIVLFLFARRSLMLHRIESSRDGLR